MFKELYKSVYFYVYFYLKESFPENLKFYFSLKIYLYSNTSLMVLNTDDPIFNSEIYLTVNKSDGDYNVFS